MWFSTDLFFAVIIFSLLSAFWFLTDFLLSFLSFLSFGSSLHIQWYDLRIPKDNFR